jgi:hypothetical protein
MKQHNDIHILVMSNGGYDGLGKEREKEMKLAAQHQGFKSSKILNDANLPDGPIYNWDENIIVQNIINHL